MDLFSPGPWQTGDALRWLQMSRAGGPVLLLDEARRFAVIGHAEAVRVLSDARTFSSASGTGKHHVDVPGRSLNLADPPLSTALRRQLSLSGDSRVAPAALAVELAGKLRRQGGGDVMTELAQPLALSTFGARFGLGGEDLARLGALSRELARAPDVAAHRSADAALQAFLSDGLSGGGQGPFWSLAAALESPVDGRYLLRLLAQTGHESTAMAIGLSVDALLSWGLPFDARAPAVEELLRWTSPLVRFVREVRYETELGGQALRPGDRLAVFFPAVNRDPGVFEAPDELRLERVPNPHLAFGAGPHACFGADLARAQVAAALGALSAHPPRRVVVREPLASSVTQGLTRLVVEF